MVRHKAQESSFFLMDPTIKEISGKTKLNPKMLFSNQSPLHIQEASRAMFITAWAKKLDRTMSLMGNLTKEKE